MTDTERRAAAKQFAADWQGRGDEKQETQRFWIELLTKVFGIDGSTAIAFEVPVKLDHTSFIDGYMESTRVLIEQKGRDIDLRKGYKQSDGSMLTPYHAPGTEQGPPDERQGSDDGLRLLRQGYDREQVRGGTDEDVSAADRT